MVSENLDGCVESPGGGFDSRQETCTTTPTKVIKKNGSVRIVTTPKSSKDTEIGFQQRLECHETTADNRKVKLLMQLDGGNLVHITVQWAGDNTSLEPKRWETAPDAHP